MRPWPEPAGIPRAEGGATRRAADDAIPLYPSVVREHVSNLTKLLIAGALVGLAYVLLSGESEPVEVEVAA